MSRVQSVPLQASNLAGIVLSLHFIFGAISRLHGGTHAVANVGQILLELLVPFVIGHLFRPRIGDWAGRSRKVLSITDRGSILLVVYTAFSAAVVNGVWHDPPPATLAVVGLIMFLMLAIVLATIVTVSRALDFGKPDEIAAVFCGSQKSLVSGVPIANVLFSGAALGMALIPIVVYYPAQLVVCAWFARRYAVEPAALPALSNSSDVSIGLVGLDGVQPSGQADGAMV
jgi:sodium/bile acid cotransporter 7